MNLLINYSRPISLLNSLTFLRGGISAMALALFGSILIPLLLTINLKSFLEETPKMHFLGFIVSKREIEIDPNKAKVIAEIPPPKHVKELRRLIG